jgi:hypothetical protein
MKLVPALLVALLLVSPSAAQAVTVNHLRCEHRDNPLGVDVAKPRLSWILDSGRQTAYQVVVNGVWDSGKVVSDASVGVVYAGKALEQGARYQWKVRVWDGDGKVSAWSKPATFTTGLRDWRAKWIGATDGLPNDTLGFAAEAQRADEMKWVQVDLGAARTLDRVVLQPQFHNDPEAGGWIQGYGFPLRFRVDVSNDADFKTFTTVADRSAVDCPNPGQTPVGFDANGRPARFVRLTAMKLWLRGANLPHVFTLAEMEVWSGGANVALKRPVTASDSVECCGWSKAHLTDGLVAKPAPAELAKHPHAAILLRKELAVTKPVKQATVYMSGLGMSELSLNGRKVGDAVLSPEFTDYDERVSYVVHDVTGDLKRGDNAIGVTLGNGFSATPGLGYLKWFGNGGPPRLLFQLEIEFADGTRQSVVSDESWKWSTGEITFNDLWVGEKLDARLAQPGWDKPGFADEVWHPASLVSGPRGKLFARVVAPVRVLETAAPVRVGSNVFHFDNLATGWLRLKTRGEAGDKVSVSYIDTEAGHVHFGRTLTTEFTLKGGGEEVFEPKFLFHTIDPVVRVEGLRHAPDKDTLTRCSAGIDLPRAGGFECSNPFLNRQYQVLLRTQRNYNFDYPLDPTREKSGWTQDVMGMIHTSVYDFDAAAFYWNWWQDMRDNQRADGYLGSVVPLVNRVLDDCNDPWWSGMIIYTPWQLYEYYGDRRFLEESYPAMTAYMNWLATKADADKVIEWGLGDWMEVGVTSAPKRTAVPITSTCGYHLYATIVSRAAAILGKSDDAVRYAKLAGEIKDGFNRRFLNPQTGQIGANADSQTAQILPLYLDMIPADKRPLVLDRLVANIHERGDHLSTGFIGTLHLLLGLPDWGQAELSHKIVMQQDFPGWNTLVKDGVQMETWGGGQVQMPSLGGPIGAYFYQILAGIRPGAPGFKHIIIKPAIVGDLSWVKAHHDSPYGRIVSEWKRDGKNLTMDVTIPANTMATIFVPGEAPRQVGPGRHQFKAILSGN